MRCLENKHKTINGIISGMIPLTLMLAATGRMYFSVHKLNGWRQQINMIKEETLAK